VNLFDGHKKALNQFCFRAFLKARKTNAMRSLPVSVEGYRLMLFSLKKRMDSPMSLKLERDSTPIGYVVKLIKDIWAQMKNSEK